MPGNRTSRAFTLVELLVVVGVIAVLIALLLPALQGARSTAKNIKCMSNLRQFGIVYAMYSSENKGYCLPFKYDGLTVSSVTYANATSWRELLNRYFPAPTSGQVHKRGMHVYSCPASRMDMQSNSSLVLGYGVNRQVHVQYQYDSTTLRPKWQVVKLSKIPRKNEVISMADANQPSNSSFDANGELAYTEFGVSQLAISNKANAEQLCYDGLPWWNRNSEGEVGYFPRYRHAKNRLGNFLYLDGHVQSHGQKELKIKNVTTAF